MANVKTWEQVSEEVKSILMGPPNNAHLEIMSLMHNWVDELESRWSLPKDINGTPKEQAQIGK